MSKRAKADTVTYGDHEVITPDTSKMRKLVRQARPGDDDSEVEFKLRNGWRLLPINVGPQASCYHNPNKKLRIQADPTNNYATARKQGRNAAVATIRMASRIGVACHDARTVAPEDVKQMSPGAFAGAPTTGCRAMTLTVGNLLRMLLRAVSMSITHAATSKPYGPLIM